MKVLIVLYGIISLSLLTFTSCNNGKTENLQSEVDSPRTEIKDGYKPGLGEFMLTVQTHHAKLWFAGTNKNWPLAQFEAGEIKETLDNAVKFLPERVETKDIPMIYPALDSLQAAVNKKDLKMFRKSFGNLTLTCNACHKAVHFDFNVIKIPSSEPVSNQVFNPRKEN